MTLYAGQNEMGTFHFLGLSQKMVQVAKTPEMRGVEVKNEANKENEVSWNILH